MKYRNLGKTEKAVSVLGFGAMRLPVINNDPRKIDFAQTEEMIRFAIENGINYLDTAYPYHGGESERVLGNIISGNLRNKIFLATKLPVWLINSAADCDHYFNEQLEKLKTDHIDYYLLHALNKNNWNKINEYNILEWLEKKRQQGRIRYLGFSFHDEYPLFKKIIDSYDHWDFCQIQYNYMDENYQAGKQGLDYAYEKGLGIIVMEPLRGGQLVKLPPETIKRIWAENQHQRTLAESALLWLWDQEKISLVLSGMSNIEQLKDNIITANKAEINILSRAEQKLYDKVKKKYLSFSQVPCTACEYCLPCPQNIQIPKIFEIYNMYSMFDDLARSQLYYNWIKPEIRADACIECKKCEESCPQNIQIINWLKIAHEKLNKA